MENVTVRAQDDNFVPAFSVGDAVAYRAEGICDIVDIRKESFGSQGEGEEYYILSPRNDANSSIYVPIHNERLTALMRPLLTRESLLALIGQIRDERMDWIADSRGRNTAFREILALGDRHALAVMVLTIEEHIAAAVAAGKKPGSTDTGAIGRGCKLLRDELSVVVPLYTDEEVLAVLRGEREI